MADFVYLIWHEIYDIVKNYHINFKSAGGSASTGNSRPPSPVQSKPGAGPNPSQLITKFTKVPKKISFSYFKNNFFFQKL